MSMAPNNWIHRVSTRNSPQDLQDIRHAARDLGQEFIELPMDHPIFHCVFDLRMPKNGLQVPNYYAGENSKHTGITWEYHDGEECRPAESRPRRRAHANISGFSSASTRYTSNPNETMPPTM